MKKSCTTIVLLVIFVLAAAPLGWCQQDWLKKAELGAYASNTFDETLLYENAKKEQEVTIYSYSSRVHKFGKTFEAKYPGVKVNGFDLDSTEIVTKIIAEQQAGNFVADVIFLKDPATAQHELLKKGYIVTYVPPDLASVLPERFRTPFLTHHLSMDALVYNTEASRQSPVNNLWDLVRPDWKSKVLFPDPSKMPEFIEFLATIVQHSDEMAADYRRVFGKSIQLSPDSQNAGYEWILRLLQNDAIIVGSTNDVSKAVGQPGQQAPPVGITALSRLRDKEKDPKLVFDIAYELQPIMGVATEVVVAIVNQARHPNAAKLLVHWMMGDTKGGNGYEPYFVVGNIPTRTDQPAPAGTKLLREMNVWTADPQFVWAHGLEIRDFWLSNLK